MGSFFAQMTERIGRMSPKKREITIFFKGTVEETGATYNIQGEDHPKEIFKKKHTDRRGRIVCLVVADDYTVDRKIVILGTRGRKEEQRCVLIRRKDEVVTGAMSSGSRLVLAGDIKRIEFLNVVEF